MNVVALPPSSRTQDIDEPDWRRLIPDALVGAQLVRADLWREFAHQQWCRITSELRDAGTLAAVNAHQVQRLILAYVRYDMAVAQVFSTAAVGVASTGTPMLNIWQVELRAADADATTAEMELCLNPRRRASAGQVKKKGRAATAADGYLARKA